MAGTSPACESQTAAREPPPLLLAPGGGRLRSILVRPEVPFEKRPGAIPRIALLGGIVALKCLRVHAPAERVPAADGSRSGVDVDSRLREVRLSRSQRVDDLLVLDEIHVLVVGRHVNEQRDVQLVDAVERRALDVEVALFERQAGDARLRRELTLVAWSL